MKNKFKFLTAFLVIAALISCEDDDSPVQINPEEVITTVEFTMVNSANSGDVVIFTSTDSDGNGPNAPSINIDGTVSANANYTGSVKFLNELESPAEDITVEVRDESLEHEVFYGVTTSGVSITKTDLDASNQNLLGLDTTIQTNGAGSGELTITLVHEPVKPNSGLTSAGGEEDASVTFTFNVQ